MKKIFISYKRENLEKVSRIRSEITATTGVDSWMDLSGIESGDQFENVIIRAINDCDIMIFMLSKEAIRVPDPQQPTWVQMELNYARKHNKRIVPISIDGTRSEDWDWFDFKFSGLDAIDYADRPQREKLMGNIRKWCGSTPKPEPKPQPKPEPTPKPGLPRWLMPAIAFVTGGVLLVWLIIYLSSPKNEMMPDMEGSEDDVPLENTIAKAASLVSNQRVAYAGKTYEYTGQVEWDGLPDGEGTGIYPTGTYKGNYRHGSREGQGTFECTGDHTFKGTFANDQYQQGKLTWHGGDMDGCYFQGKFRNNQPYDGTWYEKDGRYGGKVVNGEYK